MFAVTRSGARGVLHRNRNSLIVGTVGDGGRVEFEFARESCRRSQLLFGNPVTDCARNAVASQRAVLSVRLVRQSVNHPVFEGLVLV